MKKILLTGVMMLVALTIGAQIKVTPKIKKGDKKTYVVETNSRIGDNDFKVTTETLIEVKDATAEGFIIEASVVDNKFNSDTTNIMGKVMALTTNLMKNVHTAYVTDKNGQVLRLLDYEQSKKQAEEMITKLLGSVQIPDIVPKDMIVKNAMSNMTEEALMNNVRMNNSPLALNGKTISGETTDEFNTKEGIRMKRTFSVNSDGSIQSVANMNMSQEDIIQVLVKMTSGMFPDQGDAVKDQITQMVKSGMLKLTATDKAKYTLGKDGWVDTIEGETVTECMGQSTTVTTYVKRKK